MSWAFCHHDRRDSVLEDQLLLIVGLENHGILIKGTDAAAELHTAKQIKRYRNAVLTRGVQKSVLDILRRLGFHLPISFRHQAASTVNAYLLWNCLPFAQWKSRHKSCDIRRG